MYEGNVVVDLDLFIDDSVVFYFKAVDKARERDIENFEQALFLTSCKFCGKLWQSCIRTLNRILIRVCLRLAFKDYCHVKCEKEIYAEHRLKLLKSVYID